MKFVSRKTTVDRVRDLHKAQQKLARLEAQARELRAEVESLEQFLLGRYDQSFQIADDKGYLLQASYVEGSKQTVDLQKVRVHYARKGLTLPMKSSEWTHIKVDYVKGDD